MKVAGYIRVSTAEQANEGVSLDAQDSKVRLYAQLHDLRLVDVIVDAGASAKSLDRPGLIRARAMLDSGEVVGLVVTKLDRLSRSVADWNVLIDAHFGPAAGRHLFSVGDSIDTRTAAGRLVLNVLMSVAQWEREAIAERTRDALHHKRARGERVGQVAIGQALTGAGPLSKGGQPCGLAPDPAGIEALALVAELHAAAWSTRRIAAELDRRGHAPKNGGARWHHSTVAHLIKTRPRKTETHHAADRRHEAPQGTEAA